MAKICQACYVECEKLYRGICRKCYDHERYLSNPDFFKKRAALWKEHHPELARQYQVTSYRRNPARFKEKAYRWRDKNIDKVREKNKIYKRQRRRK